MVHDRDLLAEDLGLVHVVRREDDGAALGVDGPQDVPEVASRLRVQGRRRLVEEDDVGVMDEGAGDREPLLLSSRQLLRRGGTLLGEADESSIRATRSGGAPYSSAMVCSCSAAVSRSKKAVACSWTPTRGRSPVFRGQVASPKMRASPASGRRIPSMRSSRVVLPAPFGPRIPKKEPSGTDRSTPSTATVSP